MLHGDLHDPLSMSNSKCLSCLLIFQSLLVLLPCNEPALFCASSRHNLFNSVRERVKERDTGILYDKVGAWWSGGEAGGRLKGLWSLKDRLR